MRPRIDLRFRPSLIIFINETGSRIREQLQSIVHFTSFDPVLCQSVALLDVDTTSWNATPVPLGSSFADANAPHEEGVLDQLIERCLKDVQDNRRIQSIIEAGYPIPNPRTQIFIVGDAHSPELAKVLEVVHKRLSKSGFATLVCYVINAFRLRQISGALTSDSSFLDAEQAFSTYDRQAYWARRDVPNFCYLYEDMLTYPAPSFVTEQVSHYATSEALFALIAAGLTTEPFFEEQMRLNAPFTAYENVGSLSTSLIVFPRANVLDFCSARLAVALMEQWRQDLRNQNITEEKRQQLRKKARDAVDDIYRWIRDDQERPWANGPRKKVGVGELATTLEPLCWPGLDILQRDSVLLRDEPFAPALSLPEHQVLYRDQNRVLRALDEENETLFKLFWSRSIDSEYRRQRRRFANWTKLVLQRGNRAVDAYKEWDKRASEAWNAAALRINAELKSAIDQLWSSDQNGFDMATTYVDELDDRLAKLADRQSRWREEHEEDYRQFLASFEHIADGEWVVLDDEAAIINGPPGGGAGQASPTMGNVSTNTNPAASSTTSTDVGGIIGATAPTRPPSHQHLPAHEERLTQRLEQRVTWYQNRIPSLPTQIVIAIPFILALVLTILAFASPFHLQRTTLNIAIITIIVTLLVGCAHWYFNQLHRQRVKEVREDLLTFYRRYYAHRCEQREDTLRLVVLGPLRRKIQAIRERLDAIDDFIQQTRDEFEQQASQAQRELFDGPAGSRDIFIANGERLQRDNKNTLEEFAGQVSKLRVKEPLEEWLLSCSVLKRELILILRRQRESLMEMSDGDAQRQIREFAVNVTRPYLKGPFVDLQYALDKRDTWSGALGRVENPLYQAQVGVKEPQFLFVCGREQDVSKGTPFIPAQAHPVRISDTHEWVLLAAFFRGGLPTTVNAEILFPERGLSQQQGSKTTGIGGTGDILDDALPQDTVIGDSDDSLP